MSSHRKLQIQMMLERQIILYIFLSCLQGFPDSSAGKESTCRAGDPGLIPGSEDGLRKGQATYPLLFSWASLVVQSLKNLPAMQETQVGMIPWKRAGLPTPVFQSGESPCTEEPGGLQPIWSQRGHHNEPHSTEVNEFSLLSFKSPKSGETILDRCYLKHNYFYRVYLKALFSPYFKRSENIKVPESQVEHLHCKGTREIPIPSRKLA